jgi:hypothetical protein
MSIEGPLVIDDFSQPTTRASGKWTMLTDQVMGGISEGHAALEIVQSRRALHLRGTVSLERRGGFLQMARDFSGVGHVTFDASGYRGLSLTVCGTAGTYFVHLRTADTRAPWEYYSAPLPITPEWTDVHIAWVAFAPQALRRPLDVTRLVRMGVVAGQTAFEADIAVSRLSFEP